MGFSNKYICLAVCIYIYNVNMYNNSSVVVPGVRSACPRTHTYRVHHHHHELLHCLTILIDIIRDRFSLFCLVASYNAVCLGTEGKHFNVHRSMTDDTDLWKVLLCRKMLLRVTLTLTDHG